MKKFIRKKLGHRIAITSLLLAVVAFVYGYYGFNYRKDIFTNEKIYDEMAGIIPMFILLLSFLFLLCALLVWLFAKKQDNSKNG